MGALSLQHKQKEDRNVLVWHKDVRDKIQSGCKGSEEKKLLSC